MLPLAHPLLRQGDRGMKARVNEVRRSESVADIWFVPEEAIEVTPGDMFEIYRVLQSRLFSVAGWRDGSYRILVSKKGELSGWLYERQIGDVIDVRLQAGDLFRPRGGNVLCIATGTGIAPFMCAHPDELPNIIWGIKAPSQFPGWDDQGRTIWKFASIFGKHVQDAPDELLVGHTRFFDRYERVYLCGHTGMIVDMTTRLFGLGYSLGQVESEVFFP